MVNTTMSGKESVTTDRRKRSKSLTEKMVAERSDMLILFCRVAGLEPFSSPPNSKDTPRLIQEFCQIMVDYIASGHFLLYERIISGQERRQEISDLAEEIYPKISETTEIALDFNDKYDTEHAEGQVGSLEKDLSILGEALANRIELEDKLIRALS